MEREPQQYSVKRMTSDDVEPATAMRLQSWLDTYVNDDLGITREWIESRNREQLSSQRREARKERLKDSNVAGWVSYDTAGRVIGSTTPYVDEEGRQHVGSLYVAKEWHGRGVAGMLMTEVINWFDPSKPIELGVASYNERAIAFYRKWGFEIIPGSETLFANKIPEIKMIRKGDQQ